NYSDKTDRAAELVASTAVTGATSPKQQQQKQAIFAAQQALFQQTLTDRERARMISLSQGQAPQDLLPKTALCDVDKGLVSNQEEGCALQLTEEDIQRLRAENQAAFLAQTHTPMPTGKLTPVLGVADAQTLPQIQDDPDFDFPEQLETKEIYRFMLQQQDCSNNSCFWVANSKQIKPDLPQTIDATGQDFEGDPLHKYDKIKADFTASKLASLPPDATQQQRELVQSQADRSAPPYIPYTLADMDQWGQRLNQPPSPEGPAAPTMFVATTPDARVLAERWNYSTPFFYGQNAQVLTGDGSSVQDRSARLIQDMADYVVFRRESAGQITQTAASQAAQNLVAPIAQDIQNRLKDPSRKLN
ncbi:MAG: hypothetical protein MJ053_02325, partial [Elusimicrobiaceae bacterium]|nr:hypothetical protein [Elusimicrobiaceae bacterium]